MNRALIADTDRRICEELAMHLAAAGFESELAGPLDCLSSLSRLAGNDLCFVFVQAAYPDFTGILERARISAPQGLVIALADIDQRSALNQAIVAGLVDDFLPLPFSAADFHGILKLFQGKT